MSSMMKSLIRKNLLDKASGGSSTDTRESSPAHGGRSASASPSSVAQLSANSNQQQQQVTRNNLPVQLDTLEPHPDASLESLRGVRIQWVRCEVPAEDALVASVQRNSLSAGQVAATNRSQCLAGDEPFAGLFGLPTDSECSQVERRMIAAVVENSTFQMQELHDLGAFNMRPEYYNPQGTLRLRLEGEFMSSWDDPCKLEPFKLHVHKRVFGCIGVVNGHATNLDRMISSMKQKFASAKYQSCECRCIVVDPPSTFVSPGREFPIYSPTGVTVNAFVNRMMLEIAQSIVIGMLQSIRALENPSREVAGNLVTPLDKASFLDNFDPADKHVVMRTGKHHGDYLLLLGYPERALQLYGQMTTSDKLWIAGILECIASSVEGVSAGLMRSGSDAWQLFNNLMNLSRGNEVPMSRVAIQDMITVLNERVRGASRDYPAFIGQRGAVASIHSRLQSEIFSPLKTATEEYFANISIIETALTNNTELDYETITNASREFNKIVSLTADHVKLLLNESCHMYKHVSGKSSAAERALLPLWLETLRRTCAARAANKDPKLLDVINDIKPLCRNLHPIAEGRFLRRLPLLCVEGGLRRKALHSAYQIAVNDVGEGLYSEAISTLVQAAKWAGIPLVLNPDTGAVTIPQNFDPVGEQQAPSSGDKSNVAAKQRLTLRRSVSTVSSDLDTSYRASGSTQVQINILLALKDAVNKGRLPGATECHVASVLLFVYRDYLSKDQQLRMVETMIGAANRLPRFVQPVAYPPPFLKQLSPEQLPPHLAPVWTSVSGVKFISTDDKMKKYIHNGLLLNGPMVWVADVACTVSVLLSNPLDFPVELTNLELDVKIVADRKAAKSTENIKGSTADVYVMPSASLAPRTTRSVTLRVACPTEGGIAKLLGIKASIASIPFTAKLRIPLQQPILVPVLPRLPEMHVGFPRSEVEIFAGHDQHLHLTVMSVGSEPAARVQVSVHKEDCQLLDECKGECVGPLMSNKGARKHLEAVIEDDAAPSSEHVLRMGESFNCSMAVLPEPVMQDTKVSTLVVRVRSETVGCNPEPDAPPPTVGLNANDPTFSPICRRIASFPLRIFQSPTLEVRELQLSKDRRHVQAFIRNRCARFQATVENSESEVPLERMSDALIQPGQEIVLRLVVAKMPPERRRMKLPWRLTDRPHVCGSLVLDATKVLEGIKVLEPPELVEVEVQLKTEEGEHPIVWRSFNLSSRLNTPAVTPAPTPGCSPDFRDPNGVLQTSAAMHPVNLPPSSSLAMISAPISSLQPQRIRPIVLPAVRPIELTVILSAQWANPIDMDVSVGFGTLDDGALIAGPIRSRLKIGGTEGQRVELKLEAMLFTAGEHTLQVKLAHQLRHKIPLMAEHDGEVRETPLREVSMAPSLVFSPHGGSSPLSRSRMMSSAGRAETSPTQ